MFEESLVQYENPSLVTQKPTKIAIEANLKKAEQMILMSIEELMEGGTGVIDMLDVLLPPRIIEESDKFWYQKVSRAPASSNDLIHLQERLDGELIRLGAREIGLCDIRRKLYDQLFDELIRQEIVVCPERGRLLRMVRRETELSLTSIFGCYESGLAYGIKKKLASIKDVARLKCQASQLLSDIDKLREIVRDLEPRAAEAKKEIEEREAEKENEFKSVENEVLKENESYANGLMQCVKVNIELED